jgi:branched-chain amino acid transport system substrate-binding protein
VINIAAAPDITEQGYKFVFRNFPTAAMILGDAFANQKETFAIAGTAPKSVCFLHVNDTFGTAMARGIGAVMPKFDMPYKIAEEISYDPGGTRSFGRSREGQGDRRRRLARRQPSE